MAQKLRINAYTLTYLEEYMMYNSGQLEEYTLKFRISHYLLVAFFVVTPDKFMFHGDYCKRPRYFIQSFHTSLQFIQVYIPEQL